MEIAECNQCPELEHCHVFGSVVGEPDQAIYAFVGEAPGEVEAREGRPFCGPSGIFLRQALDSIGIKNYYLFNVLKCRPPQNRTPTMVEIQNCIPFLSQQLNEYKPKVIIALGKVAHEALASLKVPHLHVIHPSYALRKEMAVDEYAFELSAALSSINLDEGLPLEPFISSLHNHTDYSVGDSIRNPAEMVNRARWGNMPVLALTDHGTLAGVYDFEDAALTAGQPYIIGYEAYVDYGAGRTGHMTIWVTSLTGWKNLIKIHNMGIGASRKVTLNYNSLLENSEGLILGSACIGGVIAKILMEDGEEAAEAKIIEISEALKKTGSSFYLETMPHIEVIVNKEDSTYILSQKRLNAFYLQESKKLGIPAIVTIDTHYNNLQDKKFKMEAAAIIHRNKKELESPTSFKGETYHFMTQQEVRDNLRKMGTEDQDIDRLIQATEELASRLAGANFRLPREFKPISIGEFRLEDALRTNYEEFRGQKLSNASEETIKIYDERLKMEYDRIRRKGFEWYFKIEYEFVKRLRQARVPVGIARGSAGGSLVAYILGITKLDPIKYNLLFDRFLSEERNDPPDIDIDVATSYRSKAIQILGEVLAPNSLSGIMDYTRWKKDGAERDVCWLLNLDIYDYRKGLIHSQEALELQNAITGHIKYRSTHASGFVAYSSENEFFPLAKLSEKNNIPSIEFELNTLLKLGIAKFDVLGLTELDNIYMIDDGGQPIIDAMEAAEIFEDGELYIDRIPNIEGMLKFAIENPIGLFQIKTPSGNRTMRDINPNNFEELVHVVALNRPGPRDSGMIDLYKERKAIKPDEFLPSTETTYGCPIFQEQILVILNQAFGMSLGEADEVRRYISKKKMDKLAAIQERLSDALQDQKKKEIWDQVMNWANYGFNRSHAVAYATLTMMTIWAKYNLKEIFYAHFLNLEDDPVLLRAALREAHKLGIKIARPNLLYPHGEEFEKFSRSFYNGEAIVLGLNLVKGLGKKNSQSMAKKLAKGGFESLTPKRQELVVKAGFVGEGAFIDTSLPIENHKILPWYEYDFKDEIGEMEEGEDFFGKLIVFEDKDKIMKVEDNSGIYYLRTSKGDWVTKEEKDLGIIRGHFLKDKNNQIFLLERMNGRKSILKEGYRILYISYPKKSKKDNYYSIAVLEKAGPKASLIKCIIVDDEENLDHLSPGLVIHGNIKDGSSYFSWDARRDLQFNYKERVVHA